MIHPFHPLTGQEFEVVDCRQTWGEDRVYFYDAHGVLQHFPTPWTSVASPDPFRHVAGNRCVLRFEELVRLAELVAKLTQSQGAR